MPATQQSTASDGHNRDRAAGYRSASSTVSKADNTRTDAEANGASHRTEWTAGVAREEVENVVQASAKLASQAVRKMADEIDRTLGFSGEDGKLLRRQSRQNLEAAQRYGAIMADTLQEAGARLIESSQRRWLYNLEGAGRLASAKSLQELATIWTELFRENMQHVAQDNREVIEMAVRSSERVGKASSETAQSAAS